MGRPVDNLSGRTFGQLKVLKRSRKTNVYGQVFWKCICSCGSTVIAAAQHLRDGQNSCGCRTGEAVAASNKRRAQHGYARDSGSRKGVYQVWADMKQRCLNPNNRSFRNYGARGIKVCKRWLRFENFLKDMGERPAGRLTIERKNNNGGYTPANCVWATYAEQSRNKRPKSEWSPK